MSRKIEEFDLITTMGFDELFELVKVQDIDLCEDTVVILCQRLFEQYTSGTDDYRHAVIRLVKLIRVRS